MPEIHTFPDATQLAQAAARSIVEFGLEKIGAQGRFTLVLSGGGTPAATYRLLPELAESKRLDWTKVFLLFGDERCVPPEHPDSNFGMVQRTIIDQIDIPDRNVLPMLCTVSPEDAALAYEDQLRELLTDQWDGRLDLILLGLGSDAHTASLFPGSKVLEENSRLVLPSYVEKLDSWRLTLTPVAINSVERAYFLVQGDSKAEAVRHIFMNPHDPQRWPAHVVQPEGGQVVWFMDQAAASRLDI
jgi:6-phosphogluconolactonase